MRYAVLAALVAVAAVIVWGVGRWLVVQDELGQADAIVVLSGRMPMRAVEAARIYHQGAAARVWVMRPWGPAAALKQMGIAYVGEEFYSEKVLMALGVPSDAIRVMENETGNTADELAELVRVLRQQGGKAAIVVTSKAHTRRVLALWNRLEGAHPRSAADGSALKLIVRYAADDPYDGAHWWRTTRDALDVVREVLGLCNAWAGLPLHSAAR